MKRRIPYAVANYEEIVRDHYYFVDKTRFIHEIEDYKIPVFLRPAPLRQEPVVLDSGVLL